MTEDEMGPEHAVIGISVKVAAGQNVALGYTKHSKPVARALDRKATSGRPLRGSARSYRRRPDGLDATACQSPPVGACRTSVPPSDRLRAMWSFYNHRVPSSSSAAASRLAS